uniref:Transmembrane protein 176 n=1 Tax=Lates calcarifer TaxID=8187 RepID=A0A4W6E1J5_LATCA
MAVAVSRDLTVQVLEDVNAVKLTDRQQALRAAIQRGEPKCLGVSQVMLGLMVMSYSIPLHFTELTEVVSLGVPWWSGLMFIAAGVVAIILDKHCTMKILQVCLMVSVASTVLSVVAVIIYSVDMEKNPEVPCVKTIHGNCNDKHYATVGVTTLSYKLQQLHAQNVKWKELVKGTCQVTPGLMVMSSSIHLEDKSADR